MTFAVAPSGRPRSLRLEGELDMATAPQLMAAGEPLLDDEGDVRLELADLTFVDSTGMRAIFTLASRLSNGRLVLVDPSSAVLRVLELTGLGDVPEIVVEQSDGSEA